MLAVATDQTKLFRIRKVVNRGTTAPIYEEDPIGSVKKITKRIVVIMMDFEISMSMRVVSHHHEFRRGNVVNHF